MMLKRIWIAIRGTCEQDGCDAPQLRHAVYCERHFSERLDDVMQSAMQREVEVREQIKAAEKEREKERIKQIVREVLDERSYR